MGIFQTMRYVTPSDLSITELEYWRAVERDIPILIFIMGDDHPISAKDKAYEENSESKQKLQALKTVMETKHFVGYFNSVEDLRAQVIQALLTLIVEGTVNIAYDEQMTQTPSNSRDDLPLPLPPDIYSVPPYILTNKFIGRRDEFAQLNNWMNSANPVIVVEAIGGMGKSALTWEWVKNAHQQQAFDGVFWWSFYEGSATVDSFIRHALAYITRKTFEELNNLTYQERVSLLLDRFNKNNYLLALDGIERILVAYHRIDKAQLRDNQVGQDVDLRNCTDPRDTDVLYRFVSLKRSKVLISTRLMPRALEDAGESIQGVSVIQLKGLLPEDAYALMLERGIKSTNKERLDEFLKDIGYHSLLIKIVAGHIKNFRRAPGDFDRWYSAIGKNMNLPQIAASDRGTHILKYAFDGLEETKRRILCQMATFSDPVNYQTVSIFNPYLPPKPPLPDNLPPLPQVFPSPFGTPELAWLEHLLSRAHDEDEIAELQTEIEHQREVDERQAQYLRQNRDRLLRAEAQTKRERQRIREEYRRRYEGSDQYLAGIATFDIALTELEDRGLLQWDRENDNYDLHPVVRGYAYSLLQDEDRKVAFGKIRDHFARVPEVEKDQIWEISDVREMLEVYRALIGAGEVEYALAYYDVSLKYILFNISANYTIIECLAPIFQGNYSRLPDVNNATVIAHYLAMAFSNIGETQKSLQLSGINMNPELGHNPWEMTVRVANYSLSLRDVNKIAEFWRSLQLASEICPPEDQAWAYLDLLRANAQIGDWEEVERYYALALQADEPNAHPKAFKGRLAFYEALMLVRQGKQADTALNEAARATTEAKEKSMLLSVCSLWAEYALMQGDFVVARQKVSEAMKLAQETGESVSLYYAMLSIIEAHDQDYKRARVWMNRATDNTNTVDGGKALLYVYVSQAFQALDDSASAKHYALEAYRYAWADGGKYVNAWPLKLAAQLLDQFGIAYPHLPELDPEQIELIPYEDEIRRVYIEKAGTLTGSLKSAPKQAPFEIQGCEWFQIGTIAFFGVDDQAVIESMAHKLSGLSFLPTKPQFSKMGEELPTPEEFKIEIERSSWKEIEWTFDELRSLDKTFIIIFIESHTPEREPAYAYMNVRADRIEKLLDMSFSDEVFNIPDYATTVLTGSGMPDAEARGNLRQNYLFGEHYLNVRIFPPLSQVT